MEVGRVEGRTAHEGMAAAEAAHWSCALATAMRLKAAMLRMVFMVVVKVAVNEWLAIEM